MTAGSHIRREGDGNRLEKSSGKIYWYGAGTEILDESDLSGNFTNEYVFFGGKRIAMRVDRFAVAHKNVSSGTIDYYEEDMLGSSRTLVQAGGTSPCFDADFLPFGYEKDVTTTCSQNYKFEGKERDTETGDDDFGARYYTWRLGRWLSADWSSVPAPVPYANLTNPQTLNLYAMVSDNPESFADLDGHGCEITAPGGITCTNVMAINRPNITGEDQNKASERKSTTQQAVYTETDYHAWGQVYAGQGAASVTTTQTILTTTTRTAADGTITQTTTSTQTQTTAYYGLNDGSYLGATQTVKTTDANGYSNTGPTQSISQGQAMAAIGPDALHRAGDMAAPGFATGFMMRTNKDYNKHKATYWAAGYAIGELVFNPPKGFRDASKVIISGAFSIWQAIEDRNDDQ